MGVAMSGTGKNTGGQYEKLLLDDYISVEIQKEPGAENIRCNARFSSSEAAVNAISILISRVAEMLQVPVGHVVCVLATRLLREDTGRENNT